MKKVMLVVLAALMSLSLIGCQNKQEVGTLSGAAIGGLLGSQFGGGSGVIFTTLGGALVGGLIGGQIGKYMDQQDQQNMQSAIVNTPVNKSATWTNSKTNTTYTVTPTKNFDQSGEYCREYQTTVTVDGKAQKAYGTACRQPDGAWHMVS
jgi:surface antigen